MVRRIAIALVLSLGLLSVRGAEPCNCTHDAKCVCAACQCLKCGCQKPCAGKLAYSWRTIDADEVALMADGKQAGNYRFSDGVFRPFDGKEWGPKTSPPIDPPSPDPGDDALWEVNARRARSGLRPFIRDEGLTRAAVACARFRAERLIQGHANYFQFVPAGVRCAATGCAAWEPRLEWGSCCCEEDWTYAGAAWSMGRDGKRYMSLFVAK